MEYIIAVLGAFIAGFVALFFKQKRELEQTKRDKKSMEFEVQSEKSKRGLAIREAAIKGAKAGAQKTIDNFYSKYGHLIDSDDSTKSEE